MSSTTTETPAQTAAAPQTTPPPAPAPAAAPPPAQAADDFNLFDSAPDAPPSTTPSAPNTRPDHIPEQFWDPATNQPRIEAMAKSWTDLRRKVSQGTGQAPETPDAYALPKVEGLTEEILPPDDPLCSGAWTGSPTCCALRTSRHHGATRRSWLAWPGSRPRWRPPRRTQA